MSAVSSMTLPETNASTKDSSLPADVGHTPVSSSEPGQLRAEKHVKAPTLDTWPEEHGTQLLEPAAL